MGTVNNIQRGSRSIRLSIGAQHVLENVKLGDSIAVNGVCLTVVDFQKSQFSADVMPETYDNTTLKNLSSGQAVNLERALRLGERLGGHIVQGHVDAVGNIIEREKRDIAIIYKVRAPREVLKYVVAKGSIAIDGTSLTVVDVYPDSFTVSLIPHTAGLTILGSKQPGDSVNLESDILGRYIEKLIITGGDEEQSSSGLNAGFLAEHGFL